MENEKSDEAGAPPQTPTDIESLPCPHARPTWRMCPWCLGINGDLSNVTYVPAEPARAKPIYPAGMLEFMDADCPTALAHGQAEGSAARECPVCFAEFIEAAVAARDREWREGRAG
jgi:hypothetical protein